MSMSKRDVRAEAVGLPRDPLRDWPEFARAVYGRLCKGAEQYRNTSLELGPQRLLAELLEEIEDICGWSFLVWLRVRDMELATAGLAETVPC